MKTPQEKELEIYRKEKEKDVIAYMDRTGFYWINDIHIPR